MGRSFDPIRSSARKNSREPTNLPYVMVDIESDGPIPGDYSMICFGAVIVEPGLNRTFYGKLKPNSDRFIPDALAVSGFTREECLAFDDPKSVMESFQKWLGSNCKGRLMFVSDNNGFDWQFISVHCGLSCRWTNSRSSARHNIRTAPHAWRRAHRRRT